MDWSNRWHRAYRKAEVDEADGSSRQERVGVVLSAFEVNNLEFEEDMSTGNALLRGRSGWEDGKRVHQKEWRKQIFEVQTWRQVRGLAGAVMCENL